MKLRWFIPDPFLMALVGAVGLATVLPVRGTAASVLDGVTVAAIALLFFLHGAKLSPRAVVEGMTDLRLQLSMLASTFVLFPLLALALHPFSAGWLPPALATGVLFLATLPSTVQSSIALTALARGDVAASVCGATTSNVLGVLVTPLLVSVLVAPTDVLISFEALEGIVLQLLLPFVLGLLAHRFVASHVERHRVGLRLVDQGSIVLIVYATFAEAVVTGLWDTVPAMALLRLLGLCALLLAVVLLSTWALGHLLGLDRPRRVSLVFCGSKKSMATGVPMAKVLLAGGAVGSLVLPLMLYHQLQLMVCAVLAQRYRAAADREDAEPSTPPGGA